MFELYWTMNPVCFVMAMQQSAELTGVTGFNCLLLPDWRLYQTAPNV